MVKPGLVLARATRRHMSFIVVTYIIESDGQNNGNLPWLQLRHMMFMAIGQQHHRGGADRTAPLHEADKTFTREVVLPSILSMALTVRLVPTGCPRINRTHIFMLLCTSRGRFKLNESASLTNPLQDSHPVGSVMTSAWS